MHTGPASSEEIYFDPANFAQFRQRVAQAAATDPLANFSLKEVLIHSEAIFDLPAVLGRTAPGLDRVLVVMDKTPMRRAQASLKPLVVEILTSFGYQVTELELQGDRFGIVHPDFEQVEAVYQHIQPGLIVVGLGSGVIVDICKYACFLFDRERSAGAPIPFISVATANSAPAYASSMAIISRDGVKRTWPTRLPDAILCDTQVLRDCPHPLTMGGIGDMCAMYIASLEWYLGIYLKIIPDTPASQTILGDARKLLVRYSAQMGDQTLAGMEMLAKLLTLGGLAMTFAGDSTPMSGYEHGVAHLLDMSAEHFGRPIGNHGSQVAVAGILAVLMFERFLDELDPQAVAVDRCYPDPATMEARIRAVFMEIDPSGAMGAECWRDYQKKLAIWNNTRAGFEQLLHEWQSVRQTMRTLILPSTTYVDLLHKAGHPLTFEELGIPEAEARWAFRNAYMLRKRVSTADLLIFMGWMDAAWVTWNFSAAHHLIEQVRGKPSP